MRNASGALGALSLAACGFKPAYRAGNEDSLAKIRGQITLPDANNAEQFALRSELVSFFGEPTTPTYRLEYTYKSKTDKLAITQNSVVTRFRITASGTFTLTHIPSGQTLLKRPFHRVASYSANQDQFAADQTRAATQRRLARAVADDIALQTITTITESQYS